MKPFLKELAEKIHNEHPKLDALTFVFPNRRASLFFRKYLGELLNRPAFAPHLITIEEFITGFTSLKVPDKLDLISRLQQSYHAVTFGDALERESFDQFYFWGDMLLRDFEEVDKYMVNADLLFKDLSHQKELDSNFDFLTDEQKEFLQNFWSNFEDNQSLNKTKFLKIWKKLPAVYLHFKNQLLNVALAYEGMLHRYVAESLSLEKIEPRLAEGKLKFVGFNALTTAEEKIISFFVEHASAEVHWDADEYYVNNVTQEAGKFFRQYQKHATLGRTFPSNIPANLQGKKVSSQRIKLFGAAQPIGQAKLLSQIFAESKDLKPEETLIVLPDEKLLMPVLHGISGSVDSLNVTMGFPLSSTPLFNLIELLIDLHLTKKAGLFNHRQVLALLGHPYVIAADPVSANNKRKEILKHNWVHIPEGYLASETNLHRIIFREFLTVSSEVTDINHDLILYLKKVVEEVGTLSGLSNFDKEYAFHFIKFFNRLELVMAPKQLLNLEKVSTNESASERKPRMIQSSLKSFLRLLRLLMASQKIPFSGEPLKGLQIMGVLETRNLDFKNVFVLSLNEGAFPAISSKGSYIPYNIRKAYGLPTVEQQDAIYSYLFYRVLQRAENIYLFYNSETDVLGQGEMSRYLQQLLYESGLPIEKKVLHNPIQPLDLSSITVKKTSAVMEDLVKLNDGNIYFQGISPSALNSYIECRLRFYFRYVAKIKEPNEVEEDLDARVLGNFLHDVMENFYKHITSGKVKRIVELSDFDNSEQIITKLIDDVFIKAYKLDPEKQVIYEGQRVVVKEIVKRFADRIVEMDKSYAPFTIEALEQGGMAFNVPLDRPPYKAVISGKIDRVDRKGDVVRVIDYKTGKDKLDFESIASLFVRDGKRNKAAFQTLLYALLYKKNFLMQSSSPTVQLVPGLINRMNLFDDEFSFGLKMDKELLTNADPLLDEFEVHLKKMFEELFNPEIPFDQTGELENCKHCAYSQICYR
jgi:CRISPR/Cas system-associated exonuclease Cas4 (RecB family)